MGGFAALAKIIDDSANMELVRTGCWTLSNMLKGRDPSAARREFYKIGNAYYMKRFFQLLDSKQLQQQQQQKEVVLQIEGVIVEVVWCLTYLTSRDEPGCGAIIKAGFADRIAKLMHKDTKTSILIPCNNNLILVFSGIIRP
mmetsp:Transcript_7306/g.11513  ORF Transcript_7306/g.11513 Transcript_7306/m.11513 type:complete len:142 (+) Transcript_7306:973-1398(+)